MSYPIVKPEGTQDSVWLEGGGSSMEYEQYLEAYPQYTMKDNGKGYVYLLQARNGMVKIGQTVNLPSRMRRHRRMWKGDFDFAIIGIVCSDDCERLETKLHRQFRSKRETRKASWVSAWFHLSPEDVEYIKSLGGA